MDPTKIFIAKAIEKHGTKYDYSLVSYVNAKLKIDILCNIHGVFSITPNNHLRGVNCRKCAFANATQPNRKTTAEFIIESNIRHSHKYDYTKASYINARTPVTIICNKHGEFTKTPNLHLSAKQGCPRCADRYKMQNDWLTSLGVPDDTRHRQVAIKLKNGSRIVVDGFDNNTNTIYEFWGDMWHGNLNVLDPSHLNPKTKLTYQEHSNKTTDKINKIKSDGYNLIQIWENQWRALKRKSPIKLIELLSVLYNQPNKI